MKNGPEPSEKRLTFRPVYRYVVLVALLILLACSIYLCFTIHPRSYRTDPFRGLIIALMALFNFLAFGFKWPSAVAVALRSLAWIWMAFAFVYLAYLSRILYSE